MTLRRFFVAFTAVFAGALSIEVLDYHTVDTLAKDRWALTPQISGPLLLCAALLVLAWPRRNTIALLAACGGISIAVGLAGVWFHFASRAVALGDLVKATSWLGNPPPLAPLEFAVVGLLGLLAATWERGGSPASANASPAATACYGLGFLSSLAAIVLATLTMPSAGDLAVAIALFLGLIGYVVELASRAPIRGT
jgi:hypothetical protein